MAYVVESKTSDNWLWLKNFETEQDARSYIENHVDSIVQNVVKKYGETIQDESLYETIAKYYRVVINED